MATDWDQFEAVADPSKVNWSEYERVPDPKALAYGVSESLKEPARLMGIFMDPKVQRAAELSRVTGPAARKEQQQQMVDLFSPLAGDEAPTPEATQVASEFLTRPIKAVLPKLSEAEMQQVIEGASRRLPTPTVPWDTLAPSTTPAPEEAAKLGPADMPALKIATGVEQSVADMGNFFTSPLGIATLGLGGLPAAAQRAVALGFAAQMASQVPDIAKELGTELGKPADQRDETKIAKLVTDAAITTGFTAAGAVHGLRPAADLPMPWLSRLRTGPVQGPPAPGASLRMPAGAPAPRGEGPIELQVTTPEQRAEIERQMNLRATAGFEEPPYGQAARPLGPPQLPTPRAGEPPVVPGGPEAPSDPRAQVTRDEGLQTVNEVRKRFNIQSREEAREVLRTAYPERTSAEGIREDQGQPDKTGQAPPGGEEDRGGDLQQAPPGQPQPVGPGEEKAPAAPQDADNQRLAASLDAFEANKEKLTAEQRDAALQAMQLELARMDKAGVKIDPDVKAGIDLHVEERQRQIRGEEPPPEPSGEPVKPTPPKPPAAPAADAPAKDFEKATGWTFKPTGAVNLEGLTPEQRAQLEKVMPLNQWEFTDRRKDSPTTGLTFYTKAGATAEEIKAAHEAKLAAEKPAEAPKGPTVFLSGTESSPADIDRVAAEGKPIGVTVTDPTRNRTLSPTVRQKITDYLKKGGSVFLDSGAVNAFRKGANVIWERVLFAYNEIVNNVGGKTEKLFIIAPDVIGDPEATIALQTRFGEVLKKLLRAGANLIYPIQKGNLSLVDAVKNVPAQPAPLHGRGVRSFGDIIWGIPFTEKAWGKADLTALLEANKGKELKIHLLGGGDSDVRWLEEEARKAGVKLTATGDTSTDSEIRARKHGDTGEAPKPGSPAAMRQAYLDWKTKFAEKLPLETAGTVTLKDGRKFIVSKNIGKEPWRITSLLADGTPRGHETYRSWAEVERALYGWKDQIADVKAGKAETAAPKTTPPEAPKPAAPAAPTSADVQAKLKVPVPDEDKVKEAKDRLKAIDSRTRELQKQIDDKQKEIKDVEKVIKFQRGSPYQRSRIKESAKASDVAKYRKLIKEVDDLAMQRVALENSVREDQKLVDQSIDAGIINDPKEPLLRRLDRAVRVPNPDPELIKARDAETARVIRERYPDATDAEVAGMMGEFQRQAYFGGDIYAGSPKPESLRRAEILKHLQETNAPKADFPEELRNRIDRFDEEPGKRTAKETADLKEAITKETQRIRQEQEAEAKAAEEAKARALAEENRLVQEAQKEADSAKRVGTKGAIRTATDVRNELVRRIGAAMGKLVDTAKVELTDRGEGSYTAVQREGGEGGAGGDIEKTATGKFKVTTKKFSGGERFTATVGTEEEAKQIIKAMASEGQGKVVIGIPGDGVFRINNSGEALLKVWDRAKGIDVSGGRGPRVAREGGAEAAPTAAKTIGDWSAMKEYHGLGPDDRIHDWSPALRKIAEKIRPDAPELVTTKDVDDWIKAKVDKDAAAKKRLEERGIEPPGDSPRGEPPKLYAFGPIDHLINALGNWLRSIFPRGHGLPAATAPLGRRRLLADIVDRILGGDAAESADALLRKIAGEAVPKIMSMSREAGNAVVRFASAIVAAPHMAKSMTREVLGDNWNNEGFRRRLGAVLVEDRLRAIRQGFIDAASQSTNPTEVAELMAKAQSVNDLIGPGKPFSSEAEFQAALDDPEIQQAIERHKATVQEMAKRFHVESEGRLAGTGVHTGAFVNLEALHEDQPQMVFRGAGKGDYTRPFKRKSIFSMPAAGTAEAYELDYNRLAERMIKGNFEEYTKRKMYDQLVEDGLAAILPPGDPAPTFEGRPGVKFQILRRGALPGRTLIQNLWVHPDVAPELRQALNIDGPVKEAGLARVAGVLNKVQLAGPTDAVWHIANALSLISGSQGGKNLLTDLVRKIPGVNVVDTLVRTTLSARDILRNDPDVLRQISELAQISAIRSDRPGTNWSGRLINLVDKSARLVRDDMYKNLVERGLIEHSEEGRREFVNQVGQYNPRLMGQFESFFKEAGLSPFIVAGRNFNRMGLRKMSLSPGVRGANLQSAVQMRAVEAFGAIATLVAVPAVLNSVFTGKPQGRPGVPFGGIDTGKTDASGRPIYIDPAQWIGLRRGMRLTGVNAIIEGLRKGATTRDISKQAGRDIIGGLVHPWAGPAVQAPVITATGYTTSGYKESKDPGSYWENFKSAAANINPFLHTWAKKEETGIGAAGKAGLETLSKAFGVKTAPKLSAQQEVHQMAISWMDKSTDPKIKHKLEVAQKQDFGESDYKGLRQQLEKGNLDEAIGAYQKLLDEGKKSQDIFKAMRPFTVHEAGGQYFRSDKPFAGLSHQEEQKFLKSLTPEQRATFKKAQQERLDLFQRFQDMLREMKKTPPPVPMA